jgi:hypothetical protein
MATFEFPEMPETHLTPNLLVGAASPLWGYFGAAAAGGVAYWWMTQWARPVNVEALLATATKALPEAAAPVVVPVLETVEAAVEAVEAAAPELPPAPVGGEAAPVGLAEAVLAPEPEPEPVLEAAPEPEPVIEAPEPVTEAAPEPVIEAAPEPAVIAPPEPVAEAAPAPVVEPAKPRVRKTPANGLGEQP